jgi:outer membrane protein assembly factor BamB
MNSPFRPVFAATSLLVATLSFTAVAADWPQWHGPNRDCVIPAGSPVPTALPKELKTLWKVPVGGGFSAPVVAGGKVFYMAENGTKETAYALDAKTGKELWKVEISDKFTDEWGSGTRATPIVDGDKVYVQTCDGEFRCLSAANGKVVWGTSFDKDYGVKFLGSKAKEGTASRRGNNGTAVIDGTAVIVPVGSTEGATLVAFDKQTGSPMWKTGKDEAAYAAPVVATIAGVKQVVYLSADSLMGVDRQNGKVLWQVPVKTGAKRHTCTPLVSGDTVTISSQTIGIVRYKITKDGGAMKAAQEWATVSKEAKINLATLVQVGDYLYSQGGDKNYICVDAKTGQIKWSQGNFGKGQKDYASTIVAGKNLLILAEDGQLLLAAANPEKYTELARLQVCGNTWNFPAYVDGKLFVRDSRELACVDLLAK